MRWHRSVMLGLTALVMSNAGAGRGQAPLDAYALEAPARFPECSDRVRTAFAEASRRLAAGENEAAAPLLVELIAGGDAGLLDVGDRFLPVEAAVLELVLAAPPPAQAGFLAATEPLAAGEYQAIQDSYDPYPLRKFLRKRLLNRSGAAAIDRLAALLAEAGELNAAHTEWSRLAAAAVPAATDSPSSASAAAASALEWPALYHPDPPDPAAALARMAMVSRLMGRDERSQAEWSLLRRLFPNEVGPLSEQFGPSVAVDRASPHVISEASAGVAAAELKWSAPLAVEAFDGSGFRGDPLSSRVTCPVFPIVAAVVGRELVLWQDAQGLHAVDAAGRPAWDELDDSLFHADPVRVRLPPWGPLVYSPAIAGTRLLARLGSPTTYRPPLFRPEQEGSQIACFDLSAQGRLEWTAPDFTARGAFLAERWAYEGPPTVAGDGVFAVLRRGAARAEAHVERRDLRDGRLAWRRFLGTGDTPGRGQIQEASCNVPAVRDGALYVGSNLGAMFCLDATDGALRWAVRYSRGAAGRLAAPDAALLRAPAAPLVAGRRVFWAPTDSRRIFAADSDSGRLAWASSEDLGDASALVGVQARRLIIAGPQAAALDVDTGALLWRTSFSDDERLAGRGVLVGDRLVACTRGGELVVLDAAAGEVVARAAGLEPEVAAGSVTAFGGDWLVAGPRRLSRIAAGHSP